MVQMVSAEVPPAQQQPSPAMAGFPQLDRIQPEVGGSIADVRREIDEAYADIREFYRQEPDQVMRRVAGHTARLSELRVRIQRVEDFVREWKGVRTRELEPTLEELKMQFQIASRLFSVRELDAKIELGVR